MKNLIIIIFILFSIELKGQDNVTGYYSSNVASLGFFVERVQLFEDSTFKFEFSGDLQYHKGQGTYSYSKGIIYLKFDPYEIDTNNIESIIHAIDTTFRPKKYKYRNEKLLVYHVDGHIVKRGNALSKHKRFLFFGDRFMTKRKIYLKKRPDQELK